MRLKIDNIAHDILRYVIPTHKLDFGTGKRVVLISDLHSYHVNDRKRDALIGAIKLQNPHHIVVAGDFMDVSFGEWHSDKKYEAFCKLVKDLSDIAPVVISQGNHDINGKGAKQEEANERFKSVEKLNPGRIFALINGKTRDIEGFEVIGFSPTHDTMARVGTQTHGIARDQFVDEYNESGPEVSKDDNVITEMVGHNPHLFGIGESDKDLGRAKNVDTYYGGHWHNGYIPSKVTRANPEKYMSGHGYTERVFDYSHEGKLADVSVGYGKLTSLTRGTTWIDDMSQQIYLQLRTKDDKDVQYYINTALDKGQNIQEWEKIDKETAEKDIMNRNLHAVTVSGGIKKFNPIPFPDEPEITIVDYEGRRRK